MQRTGCSHSDFDDNLFQIQATSDGDSQRVPSVQAIDAPASLSVSVTVVVLLLVAAEGVIVRANRLALLGQQVAVEQQRLQIQLDERDALRQRDVIRLEVESPH